MPVIDGGPAGSPCSCGTVGRYPYGATRTARCTNTDCPVIAYHARPAAGTPAGGPGGPARPPHPHLISDRRPPPPPGTGGEQHGGAGGHDPGATTDQKPTTVQ